MKKIVTGCFGTIYYATLLKDNTMGQDKVDVTDDCLFASAEHLMSQDRYKENGFAGYTYNNKTDASKSITLSVYDESHVCVKNSVLEELKSRIAELKAENEQLKGRLAEAEGELER